MNINKLKNVYSSYLIFYISYRPISFFIINCYQGDIFKSISWWQFLIHLRLFSDLYIIHYAELTMNDIKADVWLEAQSYCEDE